MYCHYCGSRITGPYCKTCVSKKDEGKPETGKSAAGIKNTIREDFAYLSPAGSPNEAFRSGIQHSADLNFSSNQANSWENEIRYEKLMAIPHIRETISGYASTAKRKMTGEEFLGLYDKAFKPLTGLSMSKIGNRSQQLYLSLGVKTGKTQKERFKHAAGRVIVRVLCSLAQNAQEIQKAEQAKGGCLIRASVSSDLLSNEGSLEIKVQDLGQGMGTFVEAATLIPGQLLDWGKSKRLLNKLMKDIQELPV